MSSEPPLTATPPADAKAALHIREQMPAQGLFAGHEWRISPEPFPLGEKLARELDSLGRVLLQFYKAVNLLYRKSIVGEQPEWVARWLDQGKPADLIELQRDAAFKNDVPRVIRPDLLITDDGIRVTELDSVPGGIGLTAWLNKIYSELGFKVLGGAKGMIEGFGKIFDPAKRVRIVVSEEAATYRPEMTWMASQLGADRFQAVGPDFSDFSEGDGVYRFFELFDRANVENAAQILSLAKEGKIRLTPPPKPIFEEKMLFALLWNRNLQTFWKQQLGESFFARMLQMTPYTWLLDPSPLPPQGAFPGLNLTDWGQLKLLSQKERDLILKISGFSPHAWGARGVFLGSDLSHADWAAAVDHAIKISLESPYVLQRFNKPGLVEAKYFDFARGESTAMQGRVRLCPYYFVSGQIDSARANLGGVLATICPADKKIIHGMTEAIFAPCSE